jgi:hypothetical protein
MSWSRAGRRGPAIAAGVAVVALTTAAHAESFAYTIYKDSDPIGHDVYVISSDGDEKTVRVETQTAVKVLFISYHYHHTRTEVWKGATLESFVSDTDDDGTKHHVEAHQDGGKLTAIADGKHVSMPGNAMPFTLWTHELMGPDTPLFDIADFEPLRLKFADKGDASLSLGGKTLPAHHYQISGDLQWDMWFAPDGTLLKTAFRRMGYPISFIRE